MHDQDAKSPVDRDGASIRALGLDADLQHRELPPNDIVRLARVVEDRRTQYMILSGPKQEPKLAECRPELLRDARKGDALRPVVGDFVYFTPGVGAQPAAIESVLERRSSFVRRRAGLQMREQVVVANVDIVFVMTALDGDFNVRRLERYLTLCFEAPARPVIVLTKADKVDDVEPFLAQARSLGDGLEIHAVSHLKEGGYEAVLPYLERGRTIAFLGSSGVGKSTLINKLVGHARQSVAEVRADGKGRHTTTTRQLVVLQQGAIVVDTPGMRELGVWAAALGLREAFPELSAMAQTCRFGDCRHDQEPGCALQAGIASGQLDADRVESYLKLERELEEGDAGRARSGAVPSTTSRPPRRGPTRARSGKSRRKPS